MLKFIKFQEVFSQLGSAITLSDEHFSILEQFVCYLYDYKSKSIDVVRFKILDKKYVCQNKVMDIYSLPPCKQVLFLHSSRANSIAYLWKSSVLPVVSAHDVIGIGWNQEGTIQWVEEEFPSDIKEILNDLDYNEANNVESNSESESTNNSDDDDDDFFLVFVLFNF